MHSDHRPFLLNGGDGGSGGHQKPFRFINPWVTHEGFNDLVRDNWCTESDYCNAATKFKEACSKWNKEVFGFINFKKNKLLIKIGGVQKRLENHYSAGLAELEANLVSELVTVLLQEEILWQQKSQNNWIHLGDRNT